MSKILIVYASTHGHTGKIAARIDRVLSQARHDCELRSVATEPDLKLSDYDLVIVGASIHAGHHQKDLIEWVKRHATALNMTPSAFFSVCLSAVEDTDASRQATRDLLDDFEDRTGWMPRERMTFAGALQYREYDLVTRLALQVMMRRAGHPTDTSRDYDYTDWDAVEAFALECAALIATPAPA